MDAVKVSLWLEKLQNDELCWDEGGTGAVLLQRFFKEELEIKGVRRVERLVIY
jgi:hypothetical protein